MQCKECNREFETERGLHTHIVKSHKIFIEEYYKKHFPRKDLFDNSDIIFKSIEDYSDRDFNSKENFAKWCLSADKKVVKKYIIKGFVKRCKKKNTEYIPSHLELKTIFLPSFIGISKVFDNINEFLKLVKKEKLKIKYKYQDFVELSEVEPNILIDTREQDPLKFPNSKSVKLSCGDYTTDGELFSDVFVERKSLPDLVSTLSGGIERFKREIQKAKDLDYYLVVVIEDQLTNALNWSPENSYSHAANGKFILYRIREICLEFDNVQFLFADSREKAKDLIIKIFQMKDEAKVSDLEYLKDFKLI